MLARGRAAIAGTAIADGGRSCRALPDVFARVGAFRMIASSHGTEFHGLRAYQVRFCAAFCCPATAGDIRFWPMQRADWQ